MKFEVRGPAFTMFRIPLSSLGRSLIRDLDGWVVIGEGRIVGRKADEGCVHLPNTNTSLVL
jgi:hypothetical protein